MITTVSMTSVPPKLSESTETQYRPCRLGTATGSILRTEVGRGESRMESTSPALPRDSLSRE